ncbi:MAG TPA: bifunctional [glutamine synthetase] adenylyltransferase/[glutamine synthetase]-adenylyl-L-tyrosine phosphorylase [Actinomycetota bacterium]|nr:bifunctional [glutamine synthetase] adenylyltransferase/[glutamine synthetase]-adenylyl-L-tyrosine phosphorylase [Actinomycetota bacterium]
MTASDTAALARYGLRDPAAAARELPSDWQVDGRWPRLLDLLGETADPDAALRRLCALPAPAVEAALADPGAARSLMATLGFSEYLASLVTRVDGLAGEILGGPVRERADLREMKDAALAAIAARDLTDEPTRPSFERTGAALADLGDACLRRLVEPGSGLAVMAMGKYGGRELNYASDIDVLFVSEGMDPDSAEGTARALMDAMNGPPTIFRTDADLRPQGRDGPLVRSLDAFKAYYERWAEVWEFQSLIKCRFAAGDEDVGERFLEMAHPYVWPERLGAEAIEQVRALKARAEQEVERRGLHERQVKLGRGGIRDVEFAVQLLQLVHGRHHPQLRVRSTLEALDLLGAEGFVAEEDAAELAEAYVFLRHVEHRLQLVAGRQTHTLPTQAPRREHLARGLGYRDEPGRTALEAFEDRWRRTTAVVRRIHEQLFYRPLLEAFGEVPAMRPEGALERLAAIGFDRPPRARESIVALTSGPSRRAKLMRVVLPGFLAWLAETPDPDAGLRNLLDLSRALESLPHLLVMLRDEPPVAEALCRALGTGPVLASLLQRDPALVGSLQQERGADRAALVSEAVAVVSRAADPGSAVSALRRWKDGHWLAIAVDGLGSSRGDDFVTGARELSWVADASVEAALAVARSEQDARTGAPSGDAFAVVGMGRLGGEELSYASDLDVMFVHERDVSCPDGTESRLYHTAVANRLSELLGSTPPVFRVDAELRPEGRAGPLVRSLESFRQYHERWAQTWEFQALLRARHVAGDPRVTEQLLAQAAPRVWPAELGPDQVTEIRQMKARIERERVKARQDPRLQVKLGVGGLADVEFTVQLMQMRHGHRHRALRTPNTLQAVDALRDLDLVHPRDAAWLRDAYLMLNRVRNHLYLLRGLPTDVLPTADEEVERLARSLGYGRLARSTFMEEYRRVTRRARQVCDRVFYGEGASPGDPV